MNKILFFLFSLFLFFQGLIIPCYAANVVDGVCGSGQSTASSSAPTNNLCSTGSAQMYTLSTSDTKWRWICNGISGGKSVVCSSDKMFSGVCGSNSGTFFFGKYQDSTSIGFCSQGVVSNPLPSYPSKAGDSVTWECRGINGGSDKICTLNTYEDGQCALSKWATAEIAPSPLCLKGRVDVKSSTFWNGYGWTWNCYGIDPSNKFGMAKDVSCYVEKKLDGVCGSLNGNTVSYIASYATALCSKGTASSVSGTGPWTWTCYGFGDGKNASCSAKKIENGACGSSNGQSLSSIPTSNLCSAGTASSVSGTGPWTWTCSSVGGTSASCGAKKEVISGGCGSSNGKVLTSIPTTNLCSTGTASSVSGTGPWTWTCSGSDGGTGASCKAYNKINGACGSSNGQSFTSAPTTNLCSTGTASSVSGTGPWTWTCYGSGGTNTSCSATKKIVGACGSSNGKSLSSIPTSNLCSAGTASSVSGTGPWTWTCSDSDGGTGASCSAQKTTITCNWTCNWSSCSNGTRTYTCFSTPEGCIGNNPGPVTESCIISDSKINGQCGSSNGQSFASAPTTDLCSTGTASSVSGTGPWTWTCSGSNGGTNASCGAQKTADTTCTWTCGSWSTCNNGTQTRTCTSSPAGSGCTGDNPYPMSQSCSVSGNVQCGSANNGSFTTEPTENLCTNGSLLIMIGDGPWYWVCQDENKEKGVICSAKKEVVIDGQCGDSNTKSFETKPNSSLCEAGTASSVYGSGPWLWLCNGINGGKFNVCFAQKSELSCVKENESIAVTPEGLSKECCSGLTLCSPETGIVGTRGTCKKTCSEECSDVKNSVCGKDGKTYINKCHAIEAGTTVSYTGECRKAVDGVCGSSNGQSLASIPVKNLCLAGTASSVSGTGPWTWTCSGSDGGAEASCSAQETIVFDNACGSAAGTSTTTIPTVNLCSDNSLPKVEVSGNKWVWTCGTVSCSATDPNAAFKSLFGATEMSEFTGEGSNPDTATIWLQYHCYWLPSKTIFNNYEKVSCTYGSLGSHGGCKNCTMVELKIKKKS